MKKRYLAFSVVLAAAFLMISSRFAFTSSTGAPAGTTGAPGETTCATSNCHDDNAAIDDNTFSVINITVEDQGTPVQAYQPGQTYAVTLTASESGKNKYGFELAMLNASNANAGNFSITEPTRMQLAVGNGKNYLTHTSSGTAGINDAISWTFDWQAPQTDEGDVTIYVAVNAANANNNTSGDNIYYASLALPVDMANGMKESEMEKSITVFPNPAADNINIRYTNNATQKLDVKLFNAQGQCVYQESIADFSGNYQRSIANLPEGILFLQLSTDTRTYFEKIALSR